MSEPILKLVRPPRARRASTPAPVMVSRLRATGGAIVGASVPISVFVVSHTTQLEATFGSIVLWAAVLGGLVFSAGTVYAYCCKLFGGRRWKAASYCVLAETIMTFAPSHLLPLSIAMLAILVAVNAIGTARNAMS